MSWRRFNAVRVVGYAILTPVAYFMGWLNSVTFVAILSIWALVESSLSSWRSDVPTKEEDDG